MVTEPVSKSLDAMRLLVDLQQVSEIARSLSGCLDPDMIAKRTTDGLIEKFDCAFARIWLVEPEQAVLRLVASSGMYTHTDGSFARVPMGAFKVGKIAQNRIPFLSNRLADEAWVKDRDWAIAQNITGFAGYPLAIADRVVGVLAVFSHHALSSEFLEVLQALCTTLTIVLETALQYQREKPYPSIAATISQAPLSEQVAGMLQQTRLSLVGTERSLSTSLAYVLLRTANILGQVNCNQCRLTYGEATVSLEAMVFPPSMQAQPLQEWTASILSEVMFAVSCLGGTLQTFVSGQKVLQVVLSLPYSVLESMDQAKACICIRCRSPILQRAFTHLAYLAGLTVTSIASPTTLVLTDEIEQLATSKLVLWLASTNQVTPKGVLGKVDLSIDAAQFREAVEAVLRGERWGMTEEQSPSEREQEIIMLMAAGLRDRDIANQLHISERTVKFHINNILTKLKARTRCQGMHQAILKGWIQP